MSEDSQPGTSGIRQKSPLGSDFLTTNIVRSTGFAHNLVNVVAGINHELSPWLGGAINVLTMVLRNMEHDTNCPDRAIYIKKIKTTIDALNQATTIMSVVSKNVKHLKNHSNEIGNLKTTVSSWLRFNFLNEEIRRVLERDQIAIDSDSLDFNILHSPMLLSQVFLNLIKNSIEHNRKMLNDLTINIYGQGDSVLVFEDNGKGVDSETFDSLFNYQVTSKLESGEIHGLGLAICFEYCRIMGATLHAEKVDPSGLRFYIVFRKAEENENLPEPFPCEP
jgi:signal transduction histidine kinase